MLLSKKLRHLSASLKTSKAWDRKEIEKAVETLDNLGTPNAKILDAIRKEYGDDLEVMDIAKNILR